MKWLVKSVREFPPKYKGTPRPTIAVAGRSNCGKSTLINAILGKKMAATSKTPGRTRKVHRFLINERFDLVDLPGYGFAKVGLDLKESWRQKVTDFMSGHGNIRCLLVLVDIRRGLGPLDIELIEWGKLENLRISIVLTKSDKLSRQQQLIAEKKLLDTLKEDLTVFRVSALRNQGMEELLENLQEWWLEDAYTS